MDLHRSWFLNPLNRDVVSNFRIGAPKQLPIINKSSNVTFYILYCLNYFVANFLSVQSNGVQACFHDHITGGALQKYNAWVLS